MFEQIMSKIEHDTNKYMFEIDACSKEKPADKGAICTLDKCIIIISLTEIEDRCTDIVYEENKNIRHSFCNNARSSLSQYVNKKIRITGASYSDENKERWIISSIIEVNESDEDIMMCEELDDGQKKQLIELVRGIDPIIRHDLITKAIKAVKKPKQDNTKAVYYNNRNSILSLFKIIGPVMQPDMRNECDRLLSELDNKSLAKEDRNNYIKAIKEIVSIDWTQTRVIPQISDIEEQLKKEHLGHVAQIKELLTEAKTCIIMHEMHKSINFVGRTGTGKTSLAIAYAKSLEMPYRIIDMSGVKMICTDELRGSSKVYVNGMVGSIFQKIKEVGPYGTLILKNIDEYANYSSS